LWAGNPAHWGGGTRGPRRCERRITMRKTVVLAVMAALVFAVVGCSSVEDKAAIRLTDNEGIVDTRTVTVGYVNERLDRVPLTMIPETGGDEGKREFMEDIVRKELLVIYGTRLGIKDDPRYEPAMKHFEDTKAEEMLRAELIVDPSQVSQEEVEAYYDVRDDLFQVQEISVMDAELANELYERITEGGEDFGALAVEYSTGGTAKDRGLMPVSAWIDFHPLTRVELEHLEKDDITVPHTIGATTFIYRVVSRKDPPNPKPLEGSHLQGISIEARNFKRSMNEYYLFKEWDEGANLQWNDEALAVLGTRIDEEALRIIPQDEVADANANMERARIAVIPQFESEEEGDMVLVTYNIFGDEKTVTLADYAELCAEVPGIETVKAGSRERITSFMRRIVQRECIQAKIDEKGYRTSKEMQDYLAQRSEEFVIDVTYDQEVVQNVDEPMGQEIRDYYRANLDRFVEPAGVDVQQLIVGTEEQANRARQRVQAGEATFSDLIQQLSIDEWSKAKDGIIEAYRVGERRLDYLQGVAFDLEIGELSEPVRAPGGYALVKVLKKYPERQMSFDEVSGVVRQSVINMKREELLTALLEDASNTITVDYVEENFSYIEDPVEVRERRADEPAEGGRQTVTIGQ